MHVKLSRLRTERSLHLNLLPHPKSTLRRNPLSNDPLALRLRQQPLFQRRLGLACFLPCANTRLVRAVLVVGAEDVVEVAEGG